MHSGCIFALLTLPLLVASTSATAQSIIPPNGDCLRPALSEDGRYVVFDSMATNLDPGDTTLYFDVYLFDCETRTMRLLSATPDGAAGDGPSSHPSISADGSLVVFASHATDLLSPEGSGISELYLFDRSTEQLRRLPVAGPDERPNGDCRSPRVSSDGRHIVFESVASNLVADDSNGANDVFVYSLESSRTERVSVATGGIQCLLGGGEGSISGDGRFVAFSSLSDDVAPSDANGAQDVFLHDRSTRATVLISRGLKGEAAAGPSYGPALAANASTVVFESAAPDLTDGAVSWGPHIFVVELPSGVVRRVSQDPQGKPGLGHSQHPSVSADGGVIAFASTAENLARVPLHDRLSLFVSTSASPAPVLASADSAGVAGDKDSDYPAVSPNGALVAFSTRSSNIVAQRLAAATVVVLDVATGEISPIGSPEVPGSR